jgi:hypothetical protein
LPSWHRTRCARNKFQLRAFRQAVTKTFHGFDPPALSAPIGGRRQTAGAVQMSRKWKDRRLRQEGVEYLLEKFLVEFLDLK